MGKVVDPALLAALNDPKTPAQKVTDPALLAQLNGETPPDTAPEESWAWKKAKEGFTGVRDTRDALLKAATGMIGGLAGDVAGLGATGLGMDAVLAQKLGLIDQKTVDKIDPAAVRAKVADFLTYAPANPDSLPNKILEAPGKAIGWAGDKLATSTGADKIPYLDSIVRTIPHAAAELLGVKAGKGMARAPLAAEPAVVEAAAARAGSTVAPETAAMPPAAPALPAPAGTAVAPRGAALEGEVITPPPAGATPKGLPGPQVVGRAGPEPIPQAPPRAPLEPPPVAASRGSAKAPLVKDKNATPEELRKNAVDELLANDVQLTKAQRGIGFTSQLAESGARAADTTLGKGKLAREQLHDFTAAVFDKVGIKARNATPESLRELMDSTEAAYNKAHEATVKMDGDFIKDLNEIRIEAATNPYTQGKFETLLDFILRKGKSGTMTAADATEIRSKLGSIESGSDSNITQTARDIKNSLDAAGERSATPAQAAAMREARKKFHFMRQIEGAVDTKSGLITPKRLLSVIERKRNRNEAFYGKGDQSLVKLVRAGAQVLPEALGNSGTTARAFDLAKFGAPIVAAKLAGAAFGGRLFNEYGAKAGTRTALAEKAEFDLRGSSPLNAATRQAITVPTKEEERRRLQAEALRR